MKKSLFILLLVAALNFNSLAQDYKTSLGLRAGFPYGLTIKHFLSKQNAIEGILASSYGGLVITGLYEYENWTGFYPGINWYCGAGAHVGFWDNLNNPYVRTNGSVIGIDGILGIEYTFDEIPLNLALDIFPSFNLINSSGYNGIYGGISIRYVF